MFKTLIRNKKVLFYFLIICFVNFYFLSPFIHSHQIQFHSHAESDGILHSHLEIFFDLNLGDSKNLVTKPKTHTHDYSFDEPILLQSVRNTNIVHSTYVIIPNSFITNELEVEYKIWNIPRTVIPATWENYVHQMTNTSPPTYLYIS